MHCHIRYTIALAAAALLAACADTPAPSEAASPAPQLERAGQPVDPIETAARMAAMRAAALTGDQAAAQRQLDAMQRDLMRSMKIPDAARRIDPEAARAAAGTVPGVRSANWIDQQNFLVRVDSATRRTHQTIDAICTQLQPLGDTLAVVVHLQNAAPDHPADMDILKRNCQLAPGDRAFLQTDRNLNTLDPALRAQHRASVERMQAKPKRERDAGDRAALEAIPEL